MKKIKCYWTYRNRYVHPTISSTVCARLLLLLTIVIIYDIESNRKYVHLKPKATTVVATVTLTIVIQSMGLHSAFDFIWKSILNAMCRWNECKSYITAEDEPNTGKIEFNDSVWHGMIWCACVLVASLSYNHCSPPSISL